MSQKSMVSPEDQGATFAELFFDLVFVFAITQVSHYAAHHLDGPGLLRSLMVFWLIWWGWTQFTWALKAADTDHHHVRVGTLISTGVFFAMAVSVEKAFAADQTMALWFALSYIAVRILGLGLFHKVVYSNAEHRAAVLTFAVLSTLGLAAVLAGSLVDPALRVWIWLGAMALDFSAAWRAGNGQSFGLHAGHFAERHGLIIIIALGESLIVAGSALTSSVTFPLIATGALAVLLAFLLWWTYFGWVREGMEEKLISETGPARAQLGRDAYSLMHFPLVTGVVALAVGLEAAFHPDSYSLAQVTLAVGGGLTLFLVSTAGAFWRAVGCILLAPAHHPWAHGGRAGPQRVFVGLPGAGYRLGGAFGDRSGRRDYASSPVGSSIDRLYQLKDLTVR
jgi:low temperature requirement protein LtrA